MEPDGGKKAVGVAEMVCATNKRQKPDMFGAKKGFLHICLVIGLMAGLSVPGLAYSRIKDLVNIEGVRDNVLIGYGLVVGLNSTGDMLTNSPFTEKTIQSMLERLGTNTRGDTLKTKDTASVMVTANLPAFAAQGSRIDVTVSAMGDAKSLQGGTLLVTSLMGADGQIYALAQGPVVLSSFTANGKSVVANRQVLTSGRIASGATVEREIGFNLRDAKSLKLYLRNADLTTATRISAVINAYIGQNVAETMDPATVRLNVPASYHDGATGLLTDVEQLKVEPDRPAEVVINEQSGVIVMGADARISTVAIAQGNLTVRVQDDPMDPASRMRAQTLADDNRGIRTMILKEGVSLQSLVDGLNALGVGPRDIIAILQAIKAAGALQAEIKVIG